MSVSPASAATCSGVWCSGCSCLPPLRRQGGGGGSCPAYVQVVFLTQAAHGRFHVQHVQSGCHHRFEWVHNARRMQMLLPPASQPSRAHLIQLPDAYSLLLKLRTLALALFLYRQVGWVEG